MNPPLFAHRYRADGSAEFICMSCLDVVCNVRLEGDAAPFLDEHRCEGAELPNSDGMGSVP